MTKTKIKFVLFIECFCFIYSSFLFLQISLWLLIFQNHYDQRCPNKIRIPTLKVSNKPSSPLFFLLKYINPRTLDRFAPFFFPTPRDDPPLVKIDLNALLQHTLMLLALCEHLFVECGRALIIAAFRFWSNAHETVGILYKSQSSF